MYCIAAMPCGSAACAFALRRTLGTCACSAQPSATACLQPAGRAPLVLTGTLPLLGYSVLVGGNARWAVQSGPLSQPEAEFASLVMNTMRPIFAHVSLLSVPSALWGNVVGFTVGQLGDASSLPAMQRPPATAAAIDSQLASRLSPAAGSSSERGLRFYSGARHTRALMLPPHYKGMLRREADVVDEAMVADSEPAGPAASRCYCTLPGSSVPSLQHRYPDCDYQYRHYNIGTRIAIISA